MMTPKEKMERQAILTAAHQDYEKGLNLHAFFKTHSSTVSEELVHDTFMKTWAYLVKGGEITLMRAFLYHILNDLIVDEYRKRKTMSLDILLEKGFEPSMNDSEYLFNALDGKAAVLLLSHLPEKYKKVMRMRYIQDLSLQEISLLTGQSKSTVTVQVHRGLEKLKLLHSHALERDKN